MYYSKTKPSFPVSVRLGLLAAILFVLPASVVAQIDVPYSAPNEVTLNIPGNSIAYSYFSNQLLVRLDVEAKKLEFRVPLTSFVPANTGSPQVLQRELFLTGSFPEMVILLDAPLDMLLTDQTQPETRHVQGVLIAQGVSRDIQTDLYIVPLPNQASLSATFRFDLRAPNVVLPQTYASMVQGVAEIVFQNVRWLNPNPTNR